MKFLKNINYYGYDHSVYSRCFAMINHMNQKHARIINIWFALINIFYYVCANLQILNVDVTRRNFYLVFIIVPLIIYFAAVDRGHINPILGIAGTILDLIMFEVYSVLSSNAEPYTVSWIFLIIIVIIALSYIETMARMTVILLLLSTIFCRLSFLNKPRSIASMDLSNTIVVVSLALVLHFAFQRARISQFVTTLHDIQTQRELEITSSFDALTSLLNRGKFFSLSKLALDDLADNEYVALALMDLDGFKQINDKFGHQTGDLAIRMAAKSIMDVLGIDLNEQWAFAEKILKDKCAFAGRLGGDEFIVFMRGFHNREEAMSVVYDITESLHKVEEDDIHGLRASVGFTEIPSDEKNLTKAYQRADAALYESKRNGKDQVNLNCI